MIDRVFFFVCLFREIRGISPPSGGITDQALAL